MSDNARLKKGRYNTMSAKNQNDTPDRKKRIVAAMKALSNETRLAIFERIRAGLASGRLDDENRPTVCDVASNFNMALSTISHHIKELRRAGLVSCERQGQTIL